MNQEAIMTHKYARLSLAAVLATSLMTTIHHYYRMGFFTLFLGLATIGLPLALLLSFRRTKSPLALLGYGLVSTWIIVGFGLIDGMWKSTFKIFLGNFLLANYGQYFSWAPIGSFPFEATGILASISSIFAAYYTFKFILAASSETRKPPRWEMAAVAVAAISACGYLVEKRRSEAAVNVIKI